MSQLSYNTWFPTYMQTLFILSRTYNPKDEYTVTAMKCYIQSVTRLLPDPHMVSIFLNFIQMDSTVQNHLMRDSSVNNFFQSYPHIREELVNNPRQFLDTCLSSEFTLFTWVYLLNSYVIILLNRSGHNYPRYNFMQLRQRYSVNNLDKSDWGNPLWFVIHVSPVYANGSITEIFSNVKALLSCLRFILPCQKCQIHLTENLPKIDIDSHSDSREKLFEATWILHNIVNKDTGKKEPSLQESRSYYNFN